MDLLIFPHQLFAQHPGLPLKPSRVVLIEDSLFFGDAHHPLRFHKQKLWLHRASMKRYECTLREKGCDTVYKEYDSQPNSLLHHLTELCKPKMNKPDKFVVANPTDFLLAKRLRRYCRQLEVACEFLQHPGFLNSEDENRDYRAGKKRWFMADFYKWQRQRMDILMEGDQPTGGQWSFDSVNRKKVPKQLLGEIPSIPQLKADDIDESARQYVEKRFPDNPGRLDRLYYPTSHRSAKRWLKHFLEHRFERFGDYEDAIVEGESWLWHSVLTPSLNTGLLTPHQVVQATLTFADKNEVPINSLEGFVRQIIGWREFMRATYDDLGVTMRTSNHWDHRRPIPSSFYDGTTGVLPIDETIQRVIETGYCHHIERLMTLGGFMFLCEFDPDEIYKWFMEMFVDSYDWVMVTNVYAMSQHADGGLVTTKPYFSGSSYIRKMSNYSKGPWCDTWDGLYWRWVWNHSQPLAKNPRWAMMCSMVKKMDDAKRKRHIQHAESFLEGLN